MWNEIVRKCIKNSKKDYCLIVGGLVALLILSVSSLVIQESYIKAKEESYFHRYGEWLGSISPATDEIRQLLEKDSNINKIGHIKVLQDCFFKTGKYTGTIGSLDKDMFNLGRLELVAGAMPKETKEIAVEEYFLKSMDADAKIGEPITLVIADDTGERQMQFILSGILKDWGGEWSKSKAELPSAIIHEKNELFVEYNKITTLYLSVKDTKAEMLSAVIPKLTEENAYYVHNSQAYAYDTGISDQFVEAGTIIGIMSAFSAIVIIYLLLSTFHNRRYRINMVRTLGADKSQVFHMLLKEAFYYYRASLLFVMPLIICVLLIPLVKNSLHIRLISVNIINILMMILVITFIFFIGNVIVYFLTVDNSITASYKKENIQTYNRKLPPINMTKKLTLFRLYIRNRYFYKKQSILRVGVFFISMILIVTVIIDLFNSISRYENEKKNLQFEYTITVTDIRKGLTLSELDEFGKINGITRINKEKQLFGTDKFIKVSFAGWEDSDYVNNIRRYSSYSSLDDRNLSKADFYNIGNIMGVNDENAEQFLSAIKSRTGRDIDLDKFVKGEVCILFMEPYILGKSIFMDMTYDIMPVGLVENPGNQIVYDYGMEKEQIKSGNVVTIESPLGDVDIEVADILCDNIGENNLLIDRYAGCGSIAVGEKFFNRISNENLDDVYNSVTLYSHPETNHVEVDWTVENNANLFLGVSGENYQFSNLRAFSEFMIRQMTGVVVRSIALGLLSIIILIWIIYISTFIRMKEECDRIACLRSVGMTKLKIYMMYFMEYFVEGLFAGFLGIVAAVFIQFNLMKQYMGGVFMHVWDLELSIYPVSRHIPMICGFVLVLYMVLYLTCVGISIRQVSK